MFVPAETRFGNKEILIYRCGHVGLDMVCATSRKAFVSGKQRRWLFSKRQRRFACDATPNNNKHRTTASSNWWRGAASLARVHTRCCNARDKKQKENSHPITCFAAAASISFATNRVAVPVYNYAPSVGRQASENSGSDIASRVCVGQAERRAESAKKRNSTIDESARKKRNSTCAALGWIWTFSTARCAASSIGFFSPPVIHNERCGRHASPRVVLREPWCQSACDAMPKKSNAKSCKMAASSRMRRVCRVAVCPWRQEK